MLNAFKARYLASTSMLLSAKEQTQLVRAFTRMVARLVTPSTIGAMFFECICIGPREPVDNCPYHGREARRLAHG